MKVQTGNGTDVSSCGIQENLSQRTCVRSDTAVAGRETHNKFSRIESTVLEASCSVGPWHTPLHILRHLARRIELRDADSKAQ